MKLKEDLRVEAIERQSLRRKLSAKDQIARLDQKLGVNVGAKKERSKLLQAMELQKEVEAKKEKK